MAERILGGQPELDTQQQVSTSIDYARRLETLDPRFLPKERIVDGRLVTIPKDPFLEALLDFIPHSELWAAFYPPPEFEGQMRQIFSYGLCPALGSQEQLETQFDHIKELLEKESKDSDEQEEKKRLHEFFETLMQLNAMAEEQHARRNEFGKG